MISHYPRPIKPTLSDTIFKWGVYLLLCMGGATLIKGTVMEYGYKLSYPDREEALMELLVEKEVTVKNLTKQVGEMSLSLLRIEEMLDKNLSQRVEIAQAQHTKLLSAFEENVGITYYTPSKHEGGPNTALLRPIKPGVTVACSRELLRKGWLGKKVFIPGIGVRTVEDVMANHVKGKRLDVAVSVRQFNESRPPNYFTTVGVVE